MGLRSGAAGVDRDLGSRSMAAKKQVQGQAVEAGGSGNLFGQEVQNLKRGWKRVQGAVQINIKVVYEGGVGTWRVKGKDTENS